MKRERSPEASVDPKEQRIEFLSRWVSDFHNMKDGDDSPDGGYLPGIKPGHSMRELVNRLELKPEGIEKGKVIDIIYAKSFGPARNKYKNNGGAFTCKRLFWILVHNQMLNIDDGHKVTLGKRVYEESIKPYQFYTLAWN